QFSIFQDCFELIEEYGYSIAVPHMVAAGEAHHRHRPYGGLPISHNDAVLDASEGESGSRGFKRCRLYKMRHTGNMECSKLLFHGCRMGHHSPEKHPPHPGHREHSRQLAQHDCSLFLFGAHLRHPLDNLLGQWHQRLLIHIAHDERWRNGQRKISTHRQTDINRVQIDRLLTIGDPIEFRMPRQNERSRTYDDMGIGRLDTLLTQPGNNLLRGLHIHLFRRHKIWRVDDLQSIMEPVFSSIYLFVSISHIALLFENGSPGNRSISAHMAMM